MTENLAEEFDAPVKKTINKKKLTLIGAAAIGVAVLALVINDKLSSNDDETDESTETPES